MLTFNCRMTRLYRMGHDKSIDCIVRPGQMFNYFGINIGFICCFSKYKRRPEILFRTPYLYSCFWM